MAMQTRFRHLCGHHLRGKGFFFADARTQTRGDD
jgi:hypothetical protein